MGIPYSTNLQDSLSSEWLWKALQHQTFPRQTYFSASSIQQAPVLHITEPQKPLLYSYEQELPPELTISTNLIDTIRCKIHDEAICEVAVVININVWRNIWDAVTRRL